MIKINTASFVWEEINKVYDEILIDPLSKKIELYFNKSDTTRLVKEFLENHFIENGIVSKNKILDYLLDDKLEKIIEEFNSELINEWQPADRKFFSILAKWPIAKQKAISCTNKTKRKEYISSVITPANIHLFCNIDIDGLSRPPSTKTIFSDKKKIVKIKLQFEEKFKQISEELSKIFNYNYYAPRFRNRMLSAMHINVCPYCNRQYITLFNENNVSRSTADLDHFYCKSLFPFLALSIHNFVPSCQICNSRFKQANNFFQERHINPYKRGFEKDGIFKFKKYDFLMEYPIKKDSIQFSIENPDKNEEINNSISTFRLNEIYESHMDYVEELVHYVKIYNTTQLSEYLIEFPELFGSKEDIFRFIFENYLPEDEFGKRPLSKLTKDLLDDLGVNNFYS